MKKLFMSICFLILFSPVAVSDSGRPVIGTMERQLEDAGCVFVRRHASDNEGLVFYSSFDGTWMNINGKDIQFTQVEDSTNDKVWQYKAGRYTAILKLGPIKSENEESHGNFSKAKITVIENGLRSTIKVEGGCAC